MPSITTAPASAVAAAPAPVPPDAAPGRPAPLAAVRAFAVMLGGPLLLLAAVAAAATSALRTLAARRAPHPAAAGVLAASAAYARWARPRMHGWGATDAELALALPGDEACPDPGFQQTHAIGIDAPASAVWPWIAQLGQDRGGFYSYTWLENLAGCRMRNADRIHPEWQQRSAGDTVLLYPGTGLKVLRCEPGHALVMEGGWALAVLPDGPDRCRLLARFRFPRGPASTAYALLLELPHFLMERRMLTQIKRRAEARP